MNQFRFDEKEHLYFLNDKPMTGITSVLAVIGGNKTGALIQWAANEAVKFIQDKILEAEPGTILDNLTQWLLEAKTAHRRKKEEAGEKGTNIHKEIEAIIKGAIKNFDGYIQGYVEGEIEQIKYFCNWATINKVKFLESEKRLYSEKLFVAGTCDFTCEINKQRFVGDIKTGGVYDRIPFFQTAAYRMMLEEMGEKDYEGSVVINIKKDGKFDEAKDVQCSFDYQTDLEGFLAALKIYRILTNY